MDEIIPPPDCELSSALNFVAPLKRQTTDCGSFVAKDGFSALNSRGTLRIVCRREENTMAQRAPAEDWGLCDPSDEMDGHAILIKSPNYSFSRPRPTLSPPHSLICWLEEGPFNRGTKESFITCEEIPQKDPFGGAISANEPLLGRMN